MWCLTLGCDFIHRKCRNTLSFSLCVCEQEHKMMRNQSIVGSKLPELSEAAEQEKGNGCSLEDNVPSACRTSSDSAKGVHILDARNVCSSKETATTRATFCSCQPFIFLSPSRMLFSFFSSRWHDCRTRGKKGNKCTSIITLLK